MTDPFDRILASWLSFDQRLLGDGGQGRIYRVTAIRSRPPPRPLAFKEYKSQWHNKVDAGALRHLVRLRRQLAGTPGQLLIERTAWPETVVEEKGQPVGFLMPLLPNSFVQPLSLPGNGPNEYVQVQHLLNTDAYMSRVGIQIDDAWRLVFLWDVAETIDYLHRHGVTVGDISPLNIYPGFGSAPRCFFVDCDAMQLNGRSVLPQAQTRGWEVPGVERSATVQSDAYKLALLAVRLFAGDQNTRDPAALSRLSWLLRELAQDGLDIDPMSRPAPAAWAHVLRAMALASPLGAVGRTAAGAAHGHPVRQPPSGSGSGQAGSLVHTFIAPPRRPLPALPAAPRRARSPRSRLLRYGLVVLLALSLGATGSWLASATIFDSASSDSVLPPVSVPMGPALTVPGEKITNEMTGWCLQENNPSVGISQCNDLKNQRWSVQKLDDGTSKLRNVDSGDCLEESQDVLHAARCDDSPQQRWSLLGGISGRRYQNKGTKQCIEAVGYEFELRPTACGWWSRGQGWR